MYKDQNGVCAICGGNRSTRGYKLAVDHCHKTNKIRGLLCNECNLAIGKFNHDIVLLNKAIIYLIKTGGK